jgi:hypothetical protein
MYAVLWAASFTTTPAMAQQATWPAGAELTWAIEVSVFDAHDTDEERHGPPIAGFRAHITCAAETPERRYQEARCSFPDHVVQLGASQDGRVSFSDLTLDPEVYFEVRWRADGRLARLRPRGPEPSGLSDWVRVAIGALEVRRPSKGWDETPAWRAADPAILALAGATSPMAAHLTWNVDASSDAVSLSGTGGGAIDPTWVAELLGEIRDPITLHANDRVQLDAEGTVIRRVQTSWLRATDGQGTGNFGSQRVQATLSSPQTTP